MQNLNITYPTAIILLRDISNHFGLKNHTGLADQIDEYAMNIYYPHYFEDQYIKSLFNQKYFSAQIAQFLIHQNPKSTVFISLSNDPTINSIQSI